LGSGQLAFVGNEEAFQGDSGKQVIDQILWQL
jgi:hypothetical protein